MSLLNPKFRTPKGEDFSEAGATITIATAGVWAADAALDWVAVGKQADLLAATGKIEPTAGFAQDTKMRLKGTVSAHATTGTNSIDIRLVDAANSNKVLASSVEGAQSAVTTTPQVFTFDTVVEIPTDADIVVQAVNHTDTDDVVMTLMELTIWHP